MPERRSALAAAYEIGRHGRTEGEPGVALREVRGLDLIQLGAWPQSFAAVCARLEAELGLRLPEDYCRATSDQGLHVFMIAPEKLWLAGSAERSVFAGVTAAFAPEEAVVTQLGQSRTVLRLTGPHVRQTLAKGLPIDLHERAFAPGAFAQSALHHVGVLLHRHDLPAEAPPQFELYIPRGFALSIWEVLIEAGEEYGIAIEAAV